METIISMCQVSKNKDHFLMVKKNKEVIESKDLRTEKLTETWRTLTNFHLNHTHTYTLAPHFLS